MAFIIKSMINFYDHLFTTLKDPRSDNYFFIRGSPLPILLVATGYVILFKYGPKLMESRKPFELKAIMAFYNLVQVVVNTGFASQAVYILFYKHKYNWSCQPVDYSTTEHGLAEQRLTYTYLCLKLLDLFDTLFIVLKKKGAQLTFLHCYHHFGILVGSYVAAKWAPGGCATMLGLVNTFVHSAMYTYYFFTTFKPELKKSIWWKKHITELQLLQFAGLSVNFTVNLLTKDCNFPKFLIWLMYIQTVFMLVMFTDFYLKAYRKKKV